MTLHMWEILLIAGGLSLDVLAYSLWKGAMQPDMTRGFVAKMLLIFTGFQMGMFFAGSLVRTMHLFDNGVDAANRMWILTAALIFFGIGAYMIVKSFLQGRKKTEEKREEDFHYRMVVFWAFITSIDSALAGVSFGVLSATLLGTALMTGIVTAVAVLLGLYLGYRLGCGPQSKLALIGGCIVIIGGVDILLHYYM